MHMRHLNENNKQIKKNLIDKADEINNFQDCDVIQDTRNEMFKTIYQEEIRQNAIALLNAVSYRIGTDDKRYGYMLSIFKELTF